MRKRKNKDGEKLLTIIIIFTAFAGVNYIKEILYIGASIIIICAITFIVIKVINNEKKYSSKNTNTPKRKDYVPKNYPNSSYSYIKINEEQINNKTKSNYQKGKEYEEQIGKYYESIGYHIIYHGIEKGKKDKGIDLIATNNNETLLIQCKNWEKSLVQQKHLKEFLWNCDDFIKNNTFKTLHVKKLFITSNKKMDYGVKKFMQEQYQNMNYKVIPYLSC